MTRHGHEAFGDRTSVSLWALMALLSVASGALAFAPSMWAWSLNLLRFVPRVAGAALWFTAFIALLPFVARSVAPALASLGEAVHRHPRGASITAAAAIASLLWSLPDRVWFTGDFIIRNPVLNSGRAFGDAFPENLPLDNLLHSTVPRQLGHALGIGADTASRLLGAIEGAVLAALAVWFVRIVGARGLPALTGLVVLVVGGYLTMFTGFGKSAGELCLVMLLACIGVLKIARGEPGLKLLFLAGAAGIALHRLAIVFVPILLVVGSPAWRIEWRGAIPGRRWLAISAAVFFGTLAIMLPRIVSIVLGYDMKHHVDSAGLGDSGRFLSATFAGPRVADLLNALVALSPLCPAIPVLAIASGGRLLHAKETRALFGMAGWLVVVALFLHPQQGIARDWDVIAWVGVSLSALVALLVMNVLGEVPRASWIGASVILGVACLTGLWLVHDTDIDAGLRRAHAMIDEPPRRTDVEIGHMWLYLGDRTAQLGEWGASSDAIRQAARYQPSRWVLVRWGIAAMMAGDPDQAREAWTTLTRRLPSDPTGWGRLALTDLDLGRCDEARLASAELVRLVPSDSSARALYSRALRCAESEPK